MAQSTIFQLWQAESRWGEGSGKSEDQNTWRHSFLQRIQVSTQGKPSAKNIETRHPPTVEVAALMQRKKNQIVFNSCPPQGVGVGEHYSSYKLTYL